MLYNYLITVYKVIVGLVTPERLIAVALGAFGLYIVWTCISLISSFQRKFNSRCQELINILFKTSDIEKRPEIIDKKADKISSGFGFGWKKFRSSQVGKPSDFIKRREALDVETNGGLLNNGKTMMRAYITFVTVLLFIFNFAYIGGENALTFITFAETLVLPFVFYVITKLFYFLHNSIKQKLYRMDIESFYEVVDLLDIKFGKQGKVVVEEAQESSEENAEAKTDDETKELSETEPVEEAQEEPENGLDKYDVFKKKNIDVSKLMNETPQSDNTLPFINVDSDYVIKDDDKIGAKQVGQGDNMSTLFDGMLQNTSGLKKNTFVDVEKNIAEIDEEKVDKLENSESAVTDNQEEKKTELENTDENSVQNEEIEPEQQTETTEEPASVETNVDAEPETENNLSSSSKFIEIEKNNNEQEINAEETNIANVVSGFKASRSKLASGGVVIERNEPIAKRERPIFSQENNVTNSYEPQEPAQTQAYENFNQEPETVDITRPDAEENAETILNTLKSVPGNYDNYTGQGFAPSTNYGSVGFDQGYGYNPQPMYNSQMNQPMAGYGYAPEPVYPNYNQPSYSAGFQQPVQQPQQSSYEQFEEDDEEEEVVVPQKKKVVRTKENEPRPRNLKSQSKKPVKEEVTEMAKRGRPKKQEFTETMVIENDKQFNEVLSRAEKLMRKSDEGLSESQSKRIEKEIKVLMDAMNRYKESK